MLKDLLAICISSVEKCVFSYFSNYLKNVFLFLSFMVVPCSFLWGLRSLALNSCPYSGRAEP